MKIDKITKLIKTEDPSNLPHDSQNFAMCIEQSSPAYTGKVENDISTASLSQFSTLFDKQALSHLNNGPPNPILLPAYALHSSGTHYVPILLPPSDILSKEPVWFDQGMRNVVLQRSNYEYLFKWILMVCYHIFISRIMNIFMTYQHYCWFQLLCFICKHLYSILGILMAKQICINLCIF